MPIDLFSVTAWRQPRLVKQEPRGPKTRISSVASSGAEGNRRVVRLRNNDASYEFDSINRPTQVRVVVRATGAPDWVVAAANDWLFPPAPEQMVRFGPEVTPNEWV